jgi:hypothetical protein
MNAVTTAVPPAAHDSAQLEQEILTRIARGGLQICEAELRYKLRWNDHEHGELLNVLCQLEAAGLVQSALHFRLTGKGRGQLFAHQRPAARAVSSIPWTLPS